MFRTGRKCFGTVAKRGFGTSSRQYEALRIGYVPEHFSTPLYFAKKHFRLDATLIPFPAGTGHMVQALNAAELDVGIGLTEGWVAALGKQGKKAGFKLVGTYVETPLCWAISTGAKRDIRSVEELKGKKAGVSRIGSGSYVMAYVLAEKQGWLEPSGKPPFDFRPYENFQNLRATVNDGQADFFMWEHFTSKRYFDNGEIKRIGEIYTPWSSWKIAARDPKDERLERMAQRINEGIAYYNDNKNEAVEYISTELDYSAADAQEWTKTVQFPKDVRGVDSVVIDKTIGILGKAGVLDTESSRSADMVGIRSASRAH
ncbi:MAG: hypothetical protein M1821_002289 [Bathelium mastoideum]|nr:MAG: hypothetical protein M1821_002289 [Bathelium mastoideum]KAI9685761.1 MAG: hypothetical protein M1822_004321 [Bathelium mastoideum]